MPASAMAPQGHARLFCGHGFFPRTSVPTLEGPPDALILIPPGGVWWRTLGGGGCRLSLHAEDDTYPSQERLDTGRLPPRGRRRPASHAERAVARQTSVACVPPCLGPLTCGAVARWGGGALAMAVCSLSFAVSANLLYGFGHVNLQIRVVIIAQYFASLVSRGHKERRQ